MNIILFGGFLGSGKTSIILNAAEYIVKQSGNSKLVIIENEVGEAGIDDKILKGEGLIVRELFSGCICCTLNTDLTICLNEIQEKYSPKHVIIEATGMAYPQRITDTLLMYGRGVEKLAKIIVVDAERWDELIEMFPVLIAGQVRHADVIFLNKIDCIEQRAVKQIKNDLSQLNDSASIYPISVHSGIDTAIWTEVVSTE